MNQQESKAKTCPYISVNTTQIGGVAVTTSFGRITDTTHKLYETCALCAPMRESAQTTAQGAQHPCATKCPNYIDEQCCHCLVGAA